MITIVNMKENKTYQKQVILEELKKVTSHPTADEVYEMSRKRLPNISMGTVYRNLEKMSSNGTILKLDISGTKKRFDATVSKHYHLRCEKCKRVEDVDLSQLFDIEKRLNALKGLEGIVDFNIEFKGICKKCSQKSEQTMNGVAS